MAHHGSILHRAWVALWLWTALASATFPEAQAAGSRSVVDTVARTLTVYADDGRRLAVYANVSVGSGGVADVHYAGDHTTPRGTYRIVSIRPSRHFEMFFQFDYPTPEQARRAMQEGRLSPSDGGAVLVAARDGRLPPQDTPLGGNIGIHGLGRGSLKIHQMFNWTEGCVALTNGQLHDFSRWATVGMRVEIR